MTYRVLVIDDNGDDLALLTQTLRRDDPNVEVQRVEAEDVLDAALASGDVGLVITARRVAWTDGLAVLRRVKARLPDCPVVMKGAVRDEAAVVEAMRCGFDDYVLMTAEELERLPDAFLAALERAATREAARELESRYRTLVDSIPVGIYRTTIDGRILAANPAMIRMLGYDDPSALLSVNVLDLYVDPEARRALVDLPQGRDAYRGLVELRRRDGATIWAESTGRLVRAAGKPLYLEGVLQDVTDRVRAERQVRFQAGLLDAVGQAVTMSDAEGRLVYWNRQAEAMFGWKAEEVLGRVALDVTPPPAERPRFLAIRERVVRGERWAGELPLRRRDGSEFTALVATSPVFDDAGRVVGIMGVTTDIAELKRAETEIRRLNADLEERVVERTRTLVAREEELAQAKELLERLISAIPGVVFQIDLGADRVVYVSPNIEHLTGYPAADFLGEADRLWALVHAEDRDPARAEVRGAAERREPSVELEYRFLDREGRVRWFYLMGRLHYGPDGAPADIVAHAMDVTARKEAEEALRLAKQVADDANQAKNEFLSRISHELRTPLNAVLGFAQLLEMDALEDEQRVSVDHIIRAGRHLLELINEVLDISSIESGRLAMTPGIVPIREVVGDALGLIQPIAARAEVAIECGVGEDDTRCVVADRKRLGQVLLNLLSNAVKYNRSGGTVSVFAEPGAPGRLRIGVADTGPGIDPAVVHRLFRPFERLGGQTAVDGSGLGLALSKRLVDSMGGAIGVESRPGEGSTFWVELPAVDGAALADDRRADRRSPLPAQASAPLTVLYVEDNLANLELIQTVLAHRPSVKLISAMQGQLGLDLAFEYRPGLILLDLHLPDLPGDEVLARLRADARTGATPVVVISADAAPAQIDRLLGGGLTAYLTKPIDVRQLIELVDVAAAAHLPAGS